jgi:hypothetical protein
MVACVAPWSPEPVKQTVVSRLPASLRLAGMAGRALPFPPFTNFRVPARGETLRAPVLTHLTFAERLTPEDRAGVFLAMIDLIFDGRSKSDWHCLSLCDFAAWDLGKALKGFVQQTLPITVYAVTAPGSGQAEDLRGACPPGFEMAMV